MSNKPTEMFDALRVLKYDLYVRTLAFCEDQGANVTGEITATWAMWEQMSAKERAEFPRAIEQGGFFRIGVRLTGGHSV